VIRAFLVFLIFFYTHGFVRAEEGLPNLPRTRYIYFQSTTLKQGKDAYAGMGVTLYSPYSWRGIQPFLEGSFATSGGIYISDNVKNMYLHKETRLGAGGRFHSRFGSHAFSIGQVKFEGKTALMDEFNLMVGKKTSFYVTSNQWFNLYENLHLGVYAQYVGGIERKTLYVAPSYRVTLFQKYQPLIGVEWSRSEDIGGKMQRMGVHFSGPPRQFAQSKFSIGLGNDGKSRAKPYYSVSILRQF
jgi:hypothetical protein